jgi:fatty-acyl-CoA synthase
VILTAEDRARLLAQQQADATPPPRRAHHAFWPKRLPMRIDVPAGSLWNNLATSSLRYPHKPALHFFDTTLTYAQLLQKAEHLGQHLCRLGAKKGDRIVVGLQNCPQLIIAHFAILRLDAVVVPVNPMNKAEELKHYVTDPDARIVITSADLAARWMEANGTLPFEERFSHLVLTHLSDEMGQDAQQEMPPAWRDWLLAQHTLPTMEGVQVHAWNDLMASDAQQSLPVVQASSEDLAMLPYTSGTTGLPKGCMHTHGSLMHNAAAGGLWANGSAMNVMLAAVPMFHITGCVTVMHSAIFAGASVVIMPRWDRDVAGRLISRHKVTHWTNIPTMIIDLLASPSFDQYDLSSLVYIGGGGAAMPQAVAQRLLEQFGLRYVEGYGLTETAAPSHSNPPDHPKQQCLGIPYISCDARVMHAETLQELPQGEVGEIVMRGPMNFKGYWKNPEATERAFVKMDGMHFFRSGDIGRVDEDGYFFITDRLKRMINASGFKVWPAEVEALMFKHPAIAEACVIATQDPYRGESVKAVVVLRVSHVGQVSEQDILAWCRENMAVYKAPRVVEFVQALPKSGSGKVMWRLLQEKEKAA